jgi:hypothetical protein
MMPCIGQTRISDSLQDCPDAASQGANVAIYDV